MALDLGLVVRDLRPRILQLAPGNAQLGLYCVCV
jgi:hypothetical protein